MYKKNNKKGIGIGLIRQIWTEMILFCTGILTIRNAMTLYKIDMTSGFILYFYICKRKTFNP